MVPAARSRARRADTLDEYPYIVALSLERSVAGGGHLRPSGAREDDSTRMRDFMVAARTLLEGTTAESIAAVRRIVASDFRDPEGLFYLARHLAHLRQVRPALELFDASSPAGSSVFRRWPAIPGSTRCAGNRLSRGCFARPRPSIARLRRRSPSFRVNRCWASRAFLERDFGTGTGIRTPVPWLRNAAGDLDGLRLRRFCWGFRTDLRAVSVVDGRFRAQSFKNLSSGQHPSAFSPSIDRTSESS